MKLIGLCIKLVYIVLAIVGTIFSTRAFDDVFLRDFYIYYTNITNYLCLIAMLICFIVEYKQLSNILKNKGDNLNSRKCVVPQKDIKNKTLDNFIFVCAILIFVTFIVYNIWLADYSLKNYFLCPYNLLFHVILPIWFIIFAITKKSKFTPLAPVYAFAGQTIYVMIIFLRSLIIKNTPGRIIYPYFFLNFETLGFWGSIKWLLFMFVFSCFTGYILYFINKLIIYLKNKNHSKTA